MDSVSLALEAVKFARDWATWLVGIDIAAIAGLFSMLFAKESRFPRTEVAVEHNRRVSVFDGRYLLLAGMLCLALSASWASIVLAGLPDVVIQLTGTTSESIFVHEIPVPFPGPLSIGIPLWVPLYMQNSTFALGILLSSFYLWSAVVEPQSRPTDQPEIPEHLTTL